MNLQTDVGEGSRMANNLIDHLGPPMRIESGNESSLSIFPTTSIQGSAKSWSISCVNPASWLPLAAGGEFTQPRAHLLADPCGS